MPEILLTPWGSIGVAVLLTILLFVESRLVPWAPFFLVFAALVPAVPLAAGGWSLGDPAALLRGHGADILVLGGALLFWEIIAATILHERVVLRAFGRHDDARWNPTLALLALTEKAGRRARFGPAGSAAAFGAYTLLWAPVAEELFYWGYLYGNLHEGWGPGAATVLTAGLFGVRHFAHFLFARGSPPWPAATWLVAATAATGILNSLLYERVGALGPLILLHLLANLLSAVWAAWAARGPRGKSPP
ncbi:MAG TPA: CPBP family intramembrane glutamic endopeptidase [Fibrobacteria bacterium]|nr:CPBP family intramembrane glutamic endopeptidase [Fibrobacteria bacterium]